MAARDEERGGGQRKTQKEQPDVSTQIAEQNQRAESEELHAEGSGEKERAMAHAVNVIIPALDEEAAIAGVLRGLRAAGFDRIVVVDNGSRDRTACIARAEGAQVVVEPMRGYGAACLAGIAALAPAAGQDIVAFIDADGSDDAEDLRRLVQLVARDEADLALGCRVTGEREPGALPAHARFGNALAGWLIRLRTGYRYRDLGPLRALRYSTLMGLGMKDRNYGWTVEMQLKAARAGLCVRELPVRYHKRVGRSKISGTIAGSARAGAKILLTIARHAD